MFRCTIPEGVEVKLSTEVVKPLVLGKRIINIISGKTSRYKVKSPEGFDEFLKTLSPEVVRVMNVENYGKFMYWTFSNGWHMFCTFGMTGQWSTKEGNHPCLEMYMGEDARESCESIYFNDPRHFGTIKFTNKAKDLTDKLNDLGWDPLQMPLDKHAPWIKQQLSRTAKPIAEVLMDQKIFAGVGNYIRAEALYQCKLSPFRGASSLKDDEVRQLCQAAVDVMEESYQHQGATIQTYKTVYGEEGRYSSCFKVYGKKKDPLGNPIVKQDIGTRTIHWCPAIQV